MTLSSSLFAAFALANYTLLLLLLLLHVSYLIPIPFLLSVSLFYITLITTVCNHHSGDSISQLQTRSLKPLLSTLTDIHNNELHPRYWGTSP